jgi:hypothetical protein
MLLTRGSHTRYPLHEVGGSQCYLPGTPNRCPSWVEVLLRVAHRLWPNSLIRMRYGESRGDVFTIASLKKTDHAAFHHLGYHHMTRISSHWSAHLSLIAIGLALFLLFIRTSIGPN